MTLTSDHIPLARVMRAVSQYYSLLLLEFRTVVQVLILVETVLELWQLGPNLLHILALTFELFRVHLDLNCAFRQQPS